MLIGIRSLLLYKIICLTILSFFFTFDPSFSLQILKRNVVKLKRNLVGVPRKRNLFILKGF